MSKRRTPSNKDSQEVASLLTAAESIAEVVDENAILVQPAIAKRTQEIITQVEPVTTGIEPVVTTNVEVVQRSSLDPKAVDNQTNIGQAAEKGKDPSQVDSSYTQLLGSTPIADATGQYGKSQ